MDKKTKPYDAASNLKTQTDARGITYSFDYNTYNQLQSKTGSEGVYNYQYVTNGMAKHSLQKVTQPNGNFQEYLFDEYGRVRKTKEKIEAEIFEFEFAFDQSGKVTSKKYPNGFTTENEYDNLGNLIRIKNQTTGTTIWALNTLNHQGKITSSILGSGASMNQTFTNLGFLYTKTDYLSAGSDFLFSYLFNEINGNLINRKNQNFGVFENFTYLNEKLTSAFATGNYLQEVEYDFTTKTNIKNKTGVGNYTYHHTKKHAVKNVENTSGLISTNQQNITFNEQNRVKEIFEGMYKAEFSYNASAHRQSMKMLITDDPTAANPAYNLSYTRYYLGNYEKEVRGNATTEVCYINTPIGLTAAYVTQNNASQLYYLHTDHLGSIIGVSNSSQQKVYEVSYEAWGQIRPTEFWFPTYEPQTAPSWLWRGFTGHEHLDEFALINMNARLYDPILGRMLSPDNYNNDITSSIAYNRYTYAFNNPLKFTDPDGNWAVYDDAIAIGLGAVFGAYMGYKIGTAKGAGWGNGLLWYTLGGAAIGGAAGWAALYTGGATAKAFSVGSNAILVGATVGAVGGATAGFITGAGYSAMQGNNANQVLRDGLKGMAIGAATGAATGALSGWFSTTKTGQSFGKWSSSHSKGRLFDKSNPYYMFRNPNKKVPLNASPANSTNLKDLDDNFNNSISNKDLGDDIQPGKLKVEKFGDNPDIEINRDYLSQKMNDHSFSNNRHDNLGLTKDKFTNNSPDLLESNKALLVEGDNQWTGLINNKEVTFRINVDNGNVRSFNGFPGPGKNRVLGTKYNYGVLNW